MAPEAVTAAIGKQPPRSPEEAAALVAQGSSKAAPSTSRYSAGKLICPPCIPGVSSWLWKPAYWSPPRGDGVDRPASIAPGANARSGHPLEAYTIAARKVAEELFTP